MKSSIVELINSTDDSFTDLNNREVMYFGTFGYKYGNIAHEAKPLPPVLSEVVSLISQHFPDSSPVTSCLITRYTNGQSSCPVHQDDEPFINPQSDIFTLSIGACREMVFGNLSSKSECKLPLPDRSLLSFSRFSQDFWSHSIPTDDQSMEPRYSLTFRCIAPYYLNHTTIIGDSNTENLNFGSDIRGRSFGKWLPGSRIKASRIHHIPPPEVVGPTRNLYIHTGVNDINRNNAKSAVSLAHDMEEKIVPYLTAYPKMRIYLSQALPSKNSNLNRSLTIFNNHLSDISKKHSNVRIVQHLQLADPYGNLPIHLGKHDKYGRPDISDYLHLGDNGMRLFAMNIKGCIINRKQTVSKENARVSDTQACPYPRGFNATGKLQSHRPSTSFSRVWFPTPRPSPGHYPPLFPPSFPPAPLFPSGPPPSQTFTGDYHGAVTGRSFHAPITNSNDGYQY